MPFRATLAGLVLLCCTVMARAHDHAGNPNWITQGGFTSPFDGSHCCGPSDCFEVPAEEVGTSARGYMLLKFREVVPYSEAQPSRDGRYWRCKFPSGARRCFFAPPPNS